MANAALTGQFNGAPTQAAINQQASLTGYTGGVMPGSMSWDQLSQQLQATGGGTYNDAAAKAQFQALTGQHPNNFNGSTPLGLSQQQINAIASAAGVNPTALQGQQTMAMQQQTYAQQMGLIAAAQTAQANPFRQQQLYQQAQSMFGGTPVAGFSAPSTVAGVGTAGGNTQGGMGYVQQMIDDIRSPAANQTSADDFMNADADAEQDRLDVVPAEQSDDAEHHPAVHAGEVRHRPDGRAAADQEHVAGVLGARDDWHGEEGLDAAQEEREQGGVQK